MKTSNITAVEFTSAKTNWHVKRAFQDFIRLIHSDEAFVEYEYAFSQQFNKKDEELVEQAGTQNSGKFNQQKTFWQALGCIAQEEESDEDNVDLN